MKTGAFITLEGGEGSGKSTQARLLARAIQGAETPVLLTHEPGGTEGAEAIRTLLVTGEPGRWDGLTETLLHVAARREHVEKTIKPALSQGKWVISDRFFDSTVAYQGYGHGVHLHLIEKLRHMTIDDFHPALTIIFDMEPEEGLERAYKRRGTEMRYEQMDIAFHERLRKGFLDIAEKHPDRCVVLDAARELEVVHQEVIDIVNRRFGTGLQTLAEVAKVAHG